MLAGEVVQVAYREVQAAWGEVSVVCGSEVEG